MRINTNIMALNAYNNLENTSNNLNSSLAKLSSGYRINKAADDASGLVISENLKSAGLRPPAGDPQRPGRHLGRADRRRCAGLGAGDAPAHPRPRDPVGQHRRVGLDRPPGRPERDRAAPQRDRPRREHDVVRERSTCSTAASAPRRHARPARRPSPRPASRSATPPRPRSPSWSTPAPPRACSVTVTIVDRYLRDRGVVPDRAPEGHRRRAHRQRRLHRRGHRPRARPRQRRLVGRARPQQHRHRPPS